MIVHYFNGVEKCLKQSDFSISPGWPEECLMTEITPMFEGFKVKSGSMDINSYVKQFIQELQGHHMPLNRKTDNYQECLTKKINYIIETLKVDTDEVLTSDYGIELRRSDLSTLYAGWLNDKIINFYFQLIVHQEGAQNIFAFDTFFTPGGMSSLIKRKHPVDVFSYHLLLVPVHVAQNHWTLFVVDFVAKKITSYDSLGHSNDVYLEKLQNFLSKEQRIKKHGVELLWDGWWIGSIGDLPRQENNSDCGVFVSQYAKCVSRGMEIKFKQSDTEKIRSDMANEILSKRLL